MGTMSESSVTSSQLDDIDLAVPANKLYEHQSDVPSPLYVARSPADGSMYSDAGPLPGAWHQPDRPRSIDERGHSPSALGGIPGERSGDLLRQDPTSPMVAIESPLQGRGRIMQDSGAAPDTAPAQRHAYVATSIPSSDASENVPARLRDPAGNATVTVDLLSPAFVLNEHQWQQASMIGVPPSDVISQRVVTGLGIDASFVRFYQLREVKQHEIVPTGHYAAYIDRSGFTLQDMEELLADNARLLETTHKSTATLESMQELVREFDADRAQLYLQIAEYKSEVRRLQERCRISEGQTKLAKQQLARSDQQRQEAHKQLEKLRQDILDLKRTLPKRSGPSMAPLSARGHPASNSQHSTTQSKPLSARGHPSDPNAQPNSTRQSGTLKTPKTPKDEKLTERAMHALEQLSQPQFVSKLEALLNAVDVRQS
eukprot:jgi/Ulvmu1/7568/UM037_0112.1